MELSQFPVWFCEYADATWFDVQLKITSYAFAILFVISEVCYREHHAGEQRRFLFNKHSLVYLLKHAGYFIALDLIGAFSRLEQTSVKGCPVAQFIFLTIIVANLIPLIPSPSSM